MSQKSKIKNHKLSAIVITRNEEERIRECLKSLFFANEIIVVDSGSIDKTVDIAKKYGAIVVEKTNSNFSDSRNRGAKMAKGNWLLYVDADERVTPALKKEILSQITNHQARSAKLRLSPITSYAIPRRNFLLGHEMKYGGWWPDYVLRLIKRKALKMWKGELHEQPEIDGKAGKLKNPLIHNTHRSLTTMIAKTNEWSEIEAKLMYDSNHPKMNITRFFTAAFREFWYRAIRRKGFLDGSVGIIEIIYQVFSRFVSYAKLWELQITEHRTPNTEH